MDGETVVAPSFFNSSDLEELDLLLKKHALAHQLNPPESIREETELYPITVPDLGDGDLKEEINECVKHVNSHPEDEGTTRALLKFFSQLEEVLCLRAGLRKRQESLIVDSQLFNNDLQISKKVTQVSELDEKDEDEKEEDNEDSHEGNSASNNGGESVSSNNGDDSASNNGVLEHSHKESSVETDVIVKPDVITLAATIHNPCLICKEESDRYCSKCKTPICVSCTVRHKQLSKDECHHIVDIHGINPNLPVIEALNFVEPFVKRFFKSLAIVRPEDLIYCHSCHDIVIDHGETHKRQMMSLIDTLKESSEPSFNIHDALKMLKKRGDNLSDAELFGLLCESGLVLLIELALKDSKDPKTLIDDSKGLVYAILAGCNKTVRVLLGHDPDLQTLLSDFPLLLHYACFHGNADLVFKLLASGSEAQVNAQDDSGRTPLFHTAARGDLQIATKLLDLGANVNTLDFGGLTPLMIALHNERHELAKHLLVRGAILL